jgi:putative transcriptional regulator
LHALRMVGADELTPRGVRGDELTPPGGRHVPRLAGASVFDPGEFLGLDPWPPRRALNVLQRARVATGLSQDELAVELGVSRQTVSSIENRRRVPSVQLALAIAAALHRTVEELFPADELSG